MSLGNKQKEHRSLEQKDLSGKEEPNNPNPLVSTNENNPGKSTAFTEMLKSQKPSSTTTAIATSSKQPKPQGYDFSPNSVLMINDETPPHLSDDHRAKSKIGKNKNRKADSEDSSEDDGYNSPSPYRPAPEPLLRLREPLRRPREPLLRRNVAIEENEEEDEEAAKLNKVLTKFAEVLGRSLNNTGGGRETKVVNFPDFRAGEQDPLQWLESFEDACKANKIREERMFDIVPLYLKGTAYTWWRNNKQRIQAWDDEDDVHNSFVHRFKRQFCTEHHRNRWIAELRSRAQRPGENVEEYFDDLEALYRKADPLNEYPEADKLRQFVGGLRPEIREPVEISAPRILEKALTRAKAAEAAFSRGVPLSSYSLNRGYLNHAAGADPEVAKLKSEFMTFAKEIKELLQKPQGTQQTQPAPTTTTTTRGPIKCYNCQQFGHIAARCPQKQGTGGSTNSRNQQTRDNGNRNNNYQRNQGGNQDFRPNTGIPDRNQNVYSQERPQATATNQALYNSLATTIAQAVQDSLQHLN
jgi:hypothetical protein